LVDFQDGGLSLRSDPTPPTTDSMLILGTAVDGPSNQPVAVDQGTLETVFGKDVQANGVPNGATIGPAFKQAWDDGCRDIRVMKITGSVANASIATVPELVTTDTINEEDLGTIAGNDATTITLINKPIVTGSLNVYAKGIIIPSALAIVNETTGVINISANSCDAGANLSMTYDYLASVVSPATNYSLSAGLTFLLPFAPTGGLISLKYNGTIVAPANYVVTGLSVKVNLYSVGVVPVVGDLVNVTFTGVSPTPTHEVETATAVGVAYAAATSLQVKNLLETPEIDSIHLYVNGAEILSPLTSAITVVGTVLSIHKEQFVSGSTISFNYMYSVSANTNETIQFASIFASDVYNQGFIQVNDIVNVAQVVIGKQIVINKPSSKKTQITDGGTAYNSTDYPVFSMMVTAINSDPNNGLYTASTEYPMTECADLVKTLQYFTGGDSGITTDKNVLYGALSGVRDANGYLLTQGAYQILEDYAVDWVVPVGVYGDDVLTGRYDNFAYQLGLFTSISSYRNDTTLGAIAMNPVTSVGLQDIQTYANALATYNNVYYMTDTNGNLLKDSVTGNPMDLGKFLSVVGGPESAYNDAALGIYYGNPAVSYAAMNTPLQPQSAPTNKVLAGALKARYRMSNTQLDSITGNRIVTFKTKTQNYGGAFAGVFCVDGVTAAVAGSDYTRLTTPKSLKTTINNVRDVSDVYLGESTSVEQRNALSASISKRLDILITQGVIQDASFTLVCSLQDQVLGQASIELSVVPPQEFRKILVVVGLKSAL
jgi:hypothetical protein